MRTSFPNSLSEISIEIERVRTRMILLGDQYGLMHPEVHECSNELDQLLLRFYELDKAVRDLAGD
jgi:hypothetical protein